MNIVLHQFWRSSASWRVRWALLIKGIRFESVTHDLLTREHEAPEYRALSPLTYVPTLVVDGRVLGESVAILDLVESLFPEPPLFPSDPWARARVRQVMELINSGIQPFQSPYVKRRHAGEDVAAQTEWARHFNVRGLDALATLLDQIDREAGSTGRFAVGDTLTAADLFLVPQLHHARGLGIDVEKWPRLVAAEIAALATDRAPAARPEVQPGAPA